MQRITAARNRHPLDCFFMIFEEGRCLQRYTIASPCRRTLLKLFLDTLAGIGLALPAPITKRCISTNVAVRSSTGALTSLHW